MLLLLVIRRAIAIDVLQVIEAAAERIIDEVVVAVRYPGVKDEVIAKRSVAIYACGTLHLFQDLVEGLCKLDDVTDDNRTRRPAGPVDQLGQIVVGDGALAIVGPGGVFLNREILHLRARGVAHVVRHLARIYLVKLDALGIGNQPWIYLKLKIPRSAFCRQTVCEVRLFGQLVVHDNGTAWASSAGIITCRGVGLHIRCAHGSVLELVGVVF